MSTGSDDKPIIGVVGGIGSGKSAVAAALARHGGRLIDADVFGHEALRQPDVKAQAAARWGSTILDAAGEVDRRKLAALVFAEVKELRALEAMSFPYIGRHILEEVAKARSAADVRFVVLDAAVMMEAGWDRHCDKVVFVDAPGELRSARVRQARGWSKEEFVQREALQFSVEKKRARAEAVVVNDGSLEKMHEQVNRLVLEWAL